MRALIVLPAAKRDLIAQADYFDAQGGTALEDRFLKECDAGFERLSPTRCRISGTSTG